MKNKTLSILVIEEHPMMRESLCAAITEEPDLKLVEVSTAIDAFELQISDQHDVFFLANKPDIILMALGNPGLDDLKAITSLRKKLVDTPILALTRDELPGQEQAALERGAHAVLAKSVSREDLLNALRSLQADESLD
jgi:DNA-binding NarL/FixJ family response regulator